jgi:hypothetical protein
MIRFAIAAALLLSFFTATAQDQQAAAPAPTISADPKAVAVTVALTASPLTGTCPFNMNLSWTASNASVCNKTGAWSGNAGASGSESVQVNAASSTYTLTCSSSTDSRTVSWTNPTQNTDGTAASLSGNKVFHSANSSTIESQNPAIVLTPAKTTYVLAGLPAGPRVVGVKATGPAPSLLDSQMSSLASFTVVLPTGADTVQAGCTTPPEPKPPTAVTISSTVWEVIHNFYGNYVGRDVGTVALNQRCLGPDAYITQGEGIEYWGVPRAKVKIYRKPKSDLLVGRCELQAAT